MIIDKELFPDEYNAVIRLLERSERIERAYKKRAEEKLQLIEECRRALNEEHTE